MEVEERMPSKTYTPAASCSTIRCAVDLAIGENLSTPCTVAGIGDRGRLSNMSPFTGAGINDPGYNKKITHPILKRRAFYTRMKKNNGHVSHARRVMNYALAAMEQMDLYCEAHPGSPSAVRRPRLFVRGELWIALLGPSVEEGIVGIGPTVTAALRAFDAQYVAGLRPPTGAIGNYRTA
jgi:hypothetical protein